MNDFWRTREDLERMRTCEVERREVAIRTPDEEDWEMYNQQYRSFNTAEPWCLMGLDGRCSRRRSATLKLNRVRESDVRRVRRLKIEVVWRERGQEENRVDW